MGAAWTANRFLQRALIVECVVEFSGARQPKRAGRRAGLQPGPISSGGLKPQPTGDSWLVTKTKEVDGPETAAVENSPEITGFERVR